jgi:hypothetical protein
LRPFSPFFDRSEDGLDAKPLMRRVFRGGPAWENGDNRSKTVGDSGWPD